MQNSLFKYECVANNVGKNLFSCPSLMGNGKLSWFSTDESVTEKSLLPVKNSSIKKYKNNASSKHIIVK